MSDLQSTDRYGIRQSLPIAGRVVVDVSCDDWDEICAEFPNPEDRISNIYVLFDDGSTLAFQVSDTVGFGYFNADGTPFGYEVDDEEDDQEGPDAAD